MAGSSQEEIRIGGGLWAWFRTGALLQNTSGLVGCFVPMLKKEKE